ncbi:MAG: methyltransferase domain-containing protein [Alphaproteobacteria bacterium]
MGRRLRLGRIETSSGTRHRHGNIEKSIAYIDRVYEDYLRYGEIEAFRGSVCEIGPGDNLGVALRILGGGAEEVVSIDRFYSRRDEAYQQAVYQVLADTYGLGHLFQGDVAESNVQQLTYLPATPAEQFFGTAGGRFDFIVSRAVLEHLTDPIAALSQMSAALKSGGMMIHRIDLRDHGMFPRHRSLEFLTVSDPVYRRMTQNSGRPNRVLVDRYRRWLNESGLSGRILVSRLAGVRTELDPACWQELAVDVREQALRESAHVRSRLARSLAKTSDQDLAVSGIVLVARKP